MKLVLATGRITGEGLDGDVLLAAQALEEVAAIVTTNEKHLGADLLERRPSRANSTSWIRGELHPLSM